MAPTRTPGRKRRDADYSAVGQYGRKTGITVPDLGPRDEFGLEPLENLFSSPQKGDSPRNQNGATTSGEDMDLDSSTQPDPSLVLASVRHNAQFLPKSRSPIKTKLGSSPRRSLGSFRSPDKSLEKTPTKYTEEPFFSRRQAQSSSRRANGTASSVMMPTGYKSIQNVLDEKRLSKLPRNTFNLMEEESEENSMDTNPYPDYNPNEGQESDDLPPLQTGSPDEFTDQEFSEGSPEGQDNTKPTIKQRNANSTQGYKRKSAYVASLEPETDLVDQIDTTSNEGQKGRPMKKQRTRQTALGGAKPNRKEAMFASNESSVALLQASKRKGPGRRNPKAPVKSAARKDESGMVTVASRSSTQSRARAPKKQLDLQNPVEPSDPVVLRSGRTSVKPLAFWQGEQIVYEYPRRIGKGLLPGGYVAVNPGRKATETIPKKRKRKAGSRRTKSQEPDLEIEDSDQEEWEITGEPAGVLSANVFAWDPETQRSIEDGHEKIEIALAPTALDERTQWDKFRTFKFGKTLTLPFFHSGVVDLPPGGEKRPKNSKKNHMIFWVFSGRVQVDVSGNIFSVGRGGMWQVPRGNSYGLSNPFGSDVRIFFAQGSYMEQPEDESALMTNAALMA